MIPFDSTLLEELDGITWLLLLRLFLSSTEHLKSIDIRYKSYSECTLHLVGGAPQSLSVNLVSDFRDSKLESNLEKEIQIWTKFTRKL